jgi:hypothetical protein
MSSALNGYRPVNVERYEVAGGELVVVKSGLVLVCAVGALKVDGYVRLDGVLRVG